MVTTLYQLQCVYLDSGIPFFHLSYSRPDWRLSLKRLLFWLWVVFLLKVFPVCLHCRFRILTYQHLYGSSLEHTLKSQRATFLEQHWGQHNEGQVVMPDWLTPVSDEFFYWRCSAKLTIESTFYNSDIIWMYKYKGIHAIYTFYVRYSWKQVQ